MTCLLSGGYDSAIAAYHMMKRGAHLSFIHFYGTGARPGESSLHVASGLVRQLVRINSARSFIACRLTQFSAKSCATLPRIPRILLYRRMMLRIARRSQGATTPWLWSPATVWGRLHRKPCAIWSPWMLPPACPCFGR